jgi:glycosyltransferase involved in cell wall biosynthesis
MTKMTNSPALRIAFVFHRGDIIGGASIYASTLAKELQNMGHEIKFFIPEAGQYSQLLESENIAWEPVPFLSRSLNPIKNILALKSLFGKLKAFNPNLVSAQASSAGALCRLMSPRLKVPVIYTPHSWVFAPGTPKLESIVGWMIERSLKQRNQAVIAVSEFERSLGIKRGVVDSNKIWMIYNGLPDTTNIAQIEPRKVGPRRIVCVARFEPQKDQDTLLRAIAELPAGAVEVVMLGDGSLMKQSRVLAAELGIEDTIEWKGASETVEEELLQADIFVLPTNWESLPLCIIEAMRAGLPVIATDVGGINELVVNNQTGYLVPQGDSAELKRAISNLIENGSKLVSMGEAGRVRYENKFTLKDMLLPTISLYQQVAKAI